MSSSFKEYLASTNNEDLVNRIEKRLAREYGERDANGDIIRDDNGLVKTMAIKTEANRERGSLNVLLKVNKLNILAANEV